MANFIPAKLQRQNAQAVGEALSEFVRQNSLSEGLLNQAVISSWNEASGAAQYTENIYRRGDALYVTLTSSVFRSRISFRKEEILLEMNRLLEESFAVSITGVKLQINKLILH